MEERSPIFDLKTVCLITGASKGYGKCMAVRFAALFPPGSLLLLVARSKEGLSNTLKQIKDICPKIEVRIHVIDLSSASKIDYELMLKNALPDNGLQHGFEQSIIVHNAGLLGDVTIGMSAQTDDDALQRYWRLTLTSFTVLNAVWHQLLNNVGLKQRLVIGITSICALQPFKSWGLYCAGKAARDMLLNTYAQEEPNVLVLNYAPGPIDTDMQHVARTQTADKELKDMFIEMKAGDKLLTSDTSVTRLIELLRQNKFESGAHVDFYDVIP